MCTIADFYAMKHLVVLLCLIIKILNAQITECGTSLKPQKLAVVGVWSRQFDNTTSQYRISDEDLSVRGYQRSDADKASSTVMLARHPEGCVVSKCGIRLTSMIQKNGAILHTDYDLVRQNDASMSNAEDDFYCARQNNSCGADVPIYRHVKHSLSGPHYAYTFDNVGQSLPGYEKEYFPICYAWKQTPSVVLFNTSDTAVCLTLPDVSNGKVVYSSSQVNIFSIGTTASLVCDHGFAGSGQSNILCTNQGWYPTTGLGKCVPQHARAASLVSAGSSGSSCPIPESIPNGNIVYSANVASSTAINSVPNATRATVLCNLAFVPTASVTTSRCVDSIWQPSLPSCVSIFDVKCPILSAPTNGELLFINSSQKPYSIESTITLKCARSYFGIGNMTATCKPGGWDKKIGHCEPISSGAACSALPTPSNGNIMYIQSNPQSLYSSGTSAYLMCNLGMTLQNSVSSICQNGVWTPPIGSCVSSSLNLGNSGGACSDLTPPIDGSITYSSGIGTHPSGSTATLSCNAGKSVSGALTSTCSNSVWSPPSLGTCGSSSSIGQTTCMSPYVMMGTLSYSPNSADVLKPSGTTVTLSCLSGYSVSGSSTSTCQSGTWTPSLGTCQLGNGGGGTGGGTLQCTSMIAPLGGQVQYSNGATMGPYPSGTTATATCSNGGSVQGSTTATCQNGMWSPMFFGTCSIIGGQNPGQCGALVVPTGAQATYMPFSLSTTSFSAGTVATVTCTVGGTPLGTSTCTNGVWTPAITSTCSNNGGTNGQCVPLTRPIGETVQYDGSIGIQTSYNSGTIARVSCQNGTSLGQTTCLAGQWIPAITTSCSGTGTGTGGTQCLSIISPIGSQITYSDGSVILHNSGVTATLSCTNGGLVQGSSSATCQNGAWTPSLGSCSTSGGSTGTGQCLFAPVVASGATLTYSSGSSPPFNSGTVATMTCPLGQTVIGSSTSTCSNSAWNPTLGTCSGSGGNTGTGQCTSPPTVPVGATLTYSSGYFAPFNSGTTATMTCPAGQNPVGASVSTCLNSQWTPAMGSCSSSGSSTQGCTPMSALSSTLLNGQMTYTPSLSSTVPIGTSVNVVCFSGYRLQGTQSATCTSTGWQPAVVGSCVPGCTPMSTMSGSLLNGQMLYSASFSPSIPIGSSVQLTCQSGYRVQGVSSSTCTMTGWQPSVVGSCVP
ncbi:unnamed protein product [Caenorhabditis bovis]|uniref:Sushi domain-containing protein n=1 Tax=Caenorhabditis bovis TaxID=2654633 RepID=A0A8S1F9G9_9PELO|nr:unnamed protein product [Caenorhabditis bovis]